MLHGTADFGLFGVFELPFLLIAVFFAFLVAAKMRGGLFGRGMQFLAWGFVVMAVGHLHMQIARFFHVDLFKATLGTWGGDTLWIAALAITWGLSAYGFYLIYSASRGR